MQPVPRVQPLPRVQKTPHNHYQSMTHSLTTSTPTYVPNVQPHAPTTTPQSLTQVIKMATPRIRSIQKCTTPHIAFNHMSRNTQSKVATPSVGPPSHKTRSQSANSDKRLQQLTEQMYALEYEVHQAMVVMFNDSGKLLNYWQLLMHPSYKIIWHITSK